MCVDGPPLATEKGPGRGHPPHSPIIKPLVNGINRRFSITLGAAVLAGSLLPATLVRADQPNMQSALSQLPAAKASLEAASRNKRGQRENALRLITQNRGGPAGH